MTREPSAWTWADATDPGTPAGDLSAIATARPDLRPGIALNPSTYPELRAWLRQLGDPGVDRALANFASAPPPAAPAASPPVPPPPGLPQVAPASRPAGPPAEISVPAGGGWPPAQAGPAGPGDPAAAARPAKSRRRRTAFLAAGVTAAVLLAGGIGATIWWRATMDGAGSPEAAATDFIAAAAGKSPVHVFGSVAPTERQVFLSAADQAQTAFPGGTADQPFGPDVQAMLATVQVELDPDDLTFRVDEVADGVAIVKVRSGEVSLTADADTLAQLVADWSAEHVDTGDFEVSTEEVRDWLIEEMSEVDGARTFSVRDFEQATGLDLVLVVVEEGGRWFVSPLLTFAEYASAESRRYGDLAPRGREVLEAGDGHDSPEAAVDALVGLRVTAGGSLSDDVIQSLPLAERRLASIYGDMVTYLQEPPEFDLEVDRAEVDGATASVFLSDLWSSDMGWSWENDVQPGIDSLSDESGLSTYSFLGLEDVTLESVPIGVVKEDGRWFVSPLQTVVAIVSSRDSVSMSEGVEDFSSGLAWNLWSETEWRLSVPDEVGEPAPAPSVEPETGQDSGWEDGAYTGDGLPPATEPWFSPAPEHDAQVWSCYYGDMHACDSLYSVTASGSDEEAYGGSCGSRTTYESGTCVERLVDGIGVSPGSVSAGVLDFEPAAEFRYDSNACAAGDMAACDLLYGKTPVGSLEEGFGSSCGYRSARTSGGCVAAYGSFLD